MTDSYDPNLSPIGHLQGQRPPAPSWFEAALAQAPERLTVQVEGAPIEMLAWGRRGDPGLLLLHGFAAHADWWTFIAPYLADGRRVVASSWSGMGGSGWRPAYSTYEYSTSSSPVYDDATGAYADDLGEGLGPVDEGEMIIRAAEQSSRDVEVILEPPAPPTSGFHWSPGGTAVLAALLLLVGGRQPRLATKWAWFWLFLHVPPAVFVFVLLEPTPLWENVPRAARPRRLTGCCSFLLGFLLAGLLTAIVPGYTELAPE